MPTRLLFLIALAACAPTLATDYPAGWGTTERIIGREAWRDVIDAPLSLRPPEAPVWGPYYLLFSSPGRFCIVDERTWYTGPRDNELFYCRWRNARL